MNEKRTTLTATSDYLNRTPRTIEEVRWDMERRMLEREKNFLKSVNLGAQLNG